MRTTRLAAFGGQIRGLVADPNLAEQTDGSLLRAFLEGNDQRAFEAILRRHGAMVFRVCERVLGNDQDAEDALQATFLALAQRAASIRKRESLASWLHGVAYRIANHARRAAARRRGHESRAPRTAPGDPALSVAWRELQRLFDEEVARLSATLRDPFIACCLENQGCADAARRLGLSEATLWKRLSRARQQLQARLARRGIALTAVLGMLAVASASDAAAIAPSLARALVDAAAHLAAGRGIEGTGVSAAVRRLLDGLKRTLLVARLKTAAAAASALVLVLGLFVAGGLAGALGEKETAPEALANAAAEPDGKPAWTDDYGDPLPDGAVARLGTSRFRHGQMIYGLAFSPDGKQIASGGADLTIRLWDCATGREVRRFAGHQDTVTFLAFVNGGKELISASGSWHRNNSDTSIRLWDVATGREIRKLVEQGDGQGNGQGRTTVALSPDGSTLALGVSRGIRLLSVQGVNRPTSIRLPIADGANRGPDRDVKLLRFSPDGRRLAVVVESVGVCVCDVPGKELLWKDSGHDTEALASDSGIAFSPDSKTLAAATAVRKPLRLFDAETGTVLRTFDGPSAAGPLVFSADGKRIYSNSWNLQSVIWEVASGKSAGRLTPEVPHHAVAVLAPDGRTLALAGERSIQFHDTATGRRLPGPEGATRPVDFLRVSADGRTLHAGAHTDADAGLRCWDLATGKQRFAFKSASAVAVSPDGRTFAAGFWEGVPEAADAATGKVLWKAQGKARFLDSLAFSPDGRLLVGLGWINSTLDLWDAATGEELDPLGTLPKGCHVKSLAAAPSGNLVALAGLDHVVRLWDVPGRKEVAQLTGMEGPVMRLDWSPDGRELAAVSAESKLPGGFIAGTPDPHVRIWDVASRKLRLSLDGPQAGSWCVAWSADGRLLAAGGEDGVVRVWERATGQERFHLTGHEGPILAVAFSPDGRRLLSGSSDTTVLVWDVALPGRGVAAARADDLPRLWEALRGAAPTADRAIRGLLASPELALRLTGERLRPAAPVSAERLARLVADLDAASFATREQASRELEALGDTAAPALRKALEANPSAEVRKRVEALLAQVDDSLPAGERLRTVRALEVLERIGTAEARTQLRGLAGGAAEASLTREARAALERLARAKQAGTRP